MKSIRNLFRLAIMAVAAAAIVACTGGKEPSTEFSSYIKAYTGGIVSGSSPIRVEFATAVGAEHPAEGLLSFAPGIKGHARWADNNTLEFLPEEGALTPGKAYNASLKLDKLVGVKNPDLKKFEFSFVVAPKKLSLEIEGVHISVSEPDKAEVSGRVRFSSTVPACDAADLLDWRYGQDGGRLEATPSSDGNGLVFTVSGLSRGSSDASFTITADAHKYGYGKAQTCSIDVPSTNGFRLISSRLVEASEPYVDAVFSQPLDPNQNPDGLFTLMNVGRYYYQKDGNRMRIYYENVNGRDISLAISGNVRSLGGERLGEDSNSSFQRDEPVPSVEIELSGTILPDPSRLILPFKARNLSAVDLRIVKIYESNVLAYLQNNDFGGTSEIRRSGRLVYRNTVRLDRDPELDLHETNHFCIDLSGIMKKEQGAIYIVRLTFNKDYSLYGKNGVSNGVASDGMVVLSADGGVTPRDEAIWDTPESYYYESFYKWNEYKWEESDDPTKDSFYMDSDRFPQISLLSSNIGLIAKSAGSGKIWVTASDIISTNPIKGAEITVYNYQLQKIGSGKTGADGLAEIEVKGKPWAISARDGKTMGYLKMVDGNENSLSRFDTGGKAIAKGLKGYIYGERGVWRPGDTLHVTLVTEDREGRLPAGHPVSMEIYTPQGQFYDKQISTNGIDGFYSFEIPTTADDPTGTWNAYFNVGGATFHKSLHIETIKPNRLKVALDVSDKVLSSGAASGFTVTSSWLTGPVAAGLKTGIEMTLSKTSTAFKGYEKYNFNNPAVKLAPSVWTIYEKNLDGSGKAYGSILMPKISDAPGMLKANFVTRVFEQGGDASINVSSALFSPYKSYVGIQVPESKTGWLETDSDYQINLAVVDKDGRPLDGQKLEYKVYKMKWSWWWDNDGDDYGAYVNSRYAQSIASGKLTSSGGKASFDFKVEYPEWGRYLVYVKNLSSGHATACTLLVDWPTWRGRSDKADPTNAKMLSFATDKNSYKAGEEATVYIPAAAGGRALVSLENGRGVISQKWVKTSENDTKYSFKVTGEMAPNFYIHITLLQPHEQSANDSPIRMYGVQSILVSDETTHLKPVITAPEVIRPQEEFNIKVKEEKGRPMTYTLAIVDEGLLDLTNFKTPDPWNEMYAKEALSVNTWDLYDEVIGAFGGRLAPVFSVGGDEDVLGQQSRESRFNPVVKFLGPFTLKGGSANHKVTLPMYVGSVRIMLVAGKAGAYGCADKTVPVRNPLMVLPTLPRVMGSGEKVTLPVNVFAMEDGIRDVTVSVKTEGPLQIAGGSEQSISFGGVGDKLVRFGLAATGEEGIAKVTVTASGAGKSARETISIAVRNPNPIITAVERKAIKAGAVENLDWTPGISAELELSGFPALNLNGNFNYVKNYSYYCTEQLAARGISLVYTMDLLNKENAAMAKEMVPEILRQVYSRQLADGGFCYWSGAGSANEWATSMVGQFLIEASGKGFKVDGGVLRAWKNFQKKAVVNYRKSTSENLDDLQQAYRLYTLALAGSPEESAMNRLKTSESLSTQAEWRLAAAYALCGKKTIAKEMVQNLTTGIEPYRDNLTFGSAARDRAMILETLVLTGDLVTAASYAEDVAASVNEDLTTQTVAFSSVAVSALASKMDTGVLTAEVDGKKVKTANAVYNEALDAKAGAVKVKNTTSGIIFVGLTTTAQAAYGASVEAASSGLDVSVAFVDTRDGGLSPLNIKQGTDFYERITVANTSGRDLSNLALTQMVPSGWEIFNERLYGGNTRAESEHSYKDIRDDRVNWFFDLPMGAKKTFWIRLQASYEGSFVLPAAFCSTMYDNSVAGNNASGKTVVSR